MSAFESMDLFAFDTAHAQPLALSVEPSTQRAITGGRQETGREFRVEWAAGFVDGEGCIHIAKQRYKAEQKRKVTYRLTFSISQNSLEVLQHFQRGMGIEGKIYAPKRRKWQNRQCYQLNYTGVRALQIINILEPYLARKHIEAQVAQEFWVDGRCGQRPQGCRSWPPEVDEIRERYYQKLKALK